MPEPRPTTLFELIVAAGRVAGPGRPVMALVLLRLRRRRPEDAAALREMAEILPPGAISPGDGAR
jgi:hypothetical protein